nr:uncharacterized protein LOC124806107 isoform X3 [Hydra vulgaris]
MNWVIKQILHRHLMQLLCHHLLWLVSLKTFFKKQLCIDLLAKTMYVLFFTFFLPYVLSTLRTFDAGLLFHQFLRFLQSTQPSTVPSTSETVVSSTSTTFRKFKSYFFVHFVCNMCICIYICFGWLEFNNKLALPNGKPQNLLYLFASHKTCCIYLQSCNMVLGGRGAVCTPFMKAIYTPL